jgi:Flp pilus assembly pilin Flp
MKSLIKFLQDEKGQAAVECVLLLSIAMSFGVLIIRKFVKPVFAKLSQMLTQSFNTQLFGANLHYFRMKR